MIDPRMTVRDIIRDHPATLAVFVRHGLIGCGGPQGPAEPLGYFARVHEVDLDRLMTELDAAAASGDLPGTQETPSPRELARENLYRRFLKAAFLFTLTGGTALGAWALSVMALRGHLGGIGRGIIQVHGHWQLFGWVGLFVVGIAYHILPRLAGVTLPSYRAAALSFVMLAAGTVLRAAQSLDPSALRSTLLVGGALLELAGCALFAWTVARILRAQSGPARAAFAYLGIGSGWLLAAALLNLGQAWHLAGRAVFEMPAYWNLPHLSIFLVGFVTFWIFGVSLRTLPLFMGLRVRPRVAAALPVPLTAAVMVFAVGEALFVSGTGGPAARWLFGVGALATALGLLTFTGALGILAPRTAAPEPGLDRGYEKFLRLGYTWLAVAALMLLVFSGFVLAGRDLDHALVGAYRHALTVGFITTVIVGMASRIVPVFRGVPLHSAALREWTFWLLATGNVIRVLFQSLSAGGDPLWLRMAGVSGFLELVALVLFAYNLWRTMDAAIPEETAAAAWKPPIAAETRVGELLAAYPGLLPVFVRHGFVALANPVLRRTVARMVSVGEACRMHGVDLKAFLIQLSEARGRPGA